MDINYHPETKQFSGIEGVVKHLLAGVVEDTRWKVRGFNRMVAGEVIVSLEYTSPERESCGYVSIQLSNVAYSMPEKG